MARFTGGSLDGAELDMPPGAGTSVHTTGGNHYELDETSGAFIFTGFDQAGAWAMSKIIGEFRDDARSEREFIEAASRPRGCNSCGLTFGSQGAYQVHRDGRWPGGCLPAEGEFLGQLVDVDGVWCTPGSAGR